MNLKICSLIFLIVSCQSPTRIPAARKKARLELIRDYSYSAQKEAPFKHPYISTFTDELNTLKFIAADHENGIESKTFKTIKDVIEEFKPEVMILEGFAGDELSPSSMMRYSSRCEKDNFLKCGENSYAIKLGIQKSIPFIGGEPEDIVISKKLSDLGYSQEDWIGFYIVRFIPQWKRNKELMNQDIKLRIEKIGQEVEQEIFNSIPSYSWDKFNQWYEEKLNRKFDLEKITTQDTAPQIEDNPTFLNKMGREVGLIRERSIILQIESMLNQYGRVLVIYGSGHLIKQRDVLIDMLGKPNSEKLY